MPRLSPESLATPRADEKEPSDLASEQRHTVLELTVRNHAGVMSHVSGLFARRAYNVDGILCMPIGDGSRSRIWLRIDEDARLEQITRQVAKLEDVIEVRRHVAEHDVFLRLEEFFREA